MGISPDGFLDDNGLVEIKCPLSAENLTAEAAIQTLPQLTNVDKNNPEKMNRNHKYIYQVQGQLNIVQRDYCYFVVWTPKSFVVVEEKRDDVFWNTKMVPFLTRFYYECMLPEILDSRYNRHMSIRDPLYITNAKNAQYTYTEGSQQVQRHISEKQDTTPCAAASNSEHDDDCVIISYNKKENRTKEEATRMKKLLDDTIYPLSLLEDNILPKNSKINDESLDRFLRIIRETSDFETQSVQYIEFPQLIDASKRKKSLQTIGGNCTDHWRCIFFDGSNCMYMIVYLAVHTTT